MPVERNEYVRCARCHWIYALATAQPGDRPTDSIKCIRNCQSTKFYSDDGTGIPAGTSVSVFVVPAGWKPEQELCECSGCHGVFVKTWSDDIPDADFAIEFHESTEPKVVVCDDCFNAMMKAFRPTALHMH